MTEENYENPKTISGVLVHLFCSLLRRHLLTLFSPWASCVFRRRSLGKVQAPSLFLRALATTSNTGIPISQKREKTETPAVEATCFEACERVLTCYRKIEVSFLWVCTVIEHEMTSQNDPNSSGTTSAASGFTAKFGSFLTSFHVRLQYRPIEN